MAHIKWDRTALRELKALPGLAVALTPAATAIGDRMRAIAPRHFGQYQRAINSTRRGAGGKFASTTQLEAGEQRARVTVADPSWHLVEYGNATTPAYRVAQNAVRGLGLRWHDPGPAG